jgi:hypothetical protein
MILVQLPFRSDDEDEIFDAILEDEPLYPITMPRNAVSILQKVVCPCALFSILADFDLAAVDPRSYPTFGIRES